jgi:hypothetical protein
MSGYACVWCGADYGGSSKTVEHWRPKATPRQDKEHRGYWWLAYAWDNLFLACDACQTHRGSSFPLRGARATCVAEISSEEPLLTHPITLALETLVTIGPDGWPETRLRPGVPAEWADIVKTTKRELGLLRMPLIRQVNLRTDEAIALADAGSWSELRALAMRHRPYSFAASVILEEREQRLPTPEEERLDLSRRLVEDWEIQQRVQPEERSAAIDRDLKTIPWTLAWLLHADREAGGDAVENELRTQPELLTAVQTHLSSLMATISTPAAHTPRGEGPP